MEASLLRIDHCILHRRFSRSLGEKSFVGNTTLRLNLLRKSLGKDWRLTFGEP